MDQKTKRNEINTVLQNIYLLDSQEREQFLRMVENTSLPAQDRLHGILRKTVRKQNEILYLACTQSPGLAGQIKEFLTARFQQVSTMVEQSDQKAAEDLLRDL